MAKRKPRPRTPEQIAEDRAQERAERRRIEKTPNAWGADGAALALPANAEVTVIRDERKRVQTAHRADIFDRLHARYKPGKPGGLSAAEHLAARKLEALLEAARGEGDKDNSSRQKIRGGSRELITATMIKAGKDADAALKTLDTRSAKMMRELLEPQHVHTNDPLNRWRLVVSWSTGLVDKDSQADRVRNACHTLAVHYGLVQSGKAA